MSEEIILKEILKWIKVEGISKLKPIFENEFNEESKILVYNFSDGRSSDEIEKLLGKMTSDMTIRNWWKRWAKLGIMELHPTYKKRYVKIFNLEDFGIEIPELPEKMEGIKLQKNISSTQELNSTKPTN